MSLSTFQINESTNPENFFLEDPENPGIYNIASRESISIAGALKCLVKKAFDGKMYFAMFEDRIEMWWRRDVDTNPVRICLWYLIGRIFHNDSWVEQPFDFDISNPEVQLNIDEETGLEYDLLWTKDAFTVTNYFGLQWVFTHKRVENKFFLFSPEKLVELIWRTDIRNAALADNRADGRGLAIPNAGSVEPAITVDTPNVNWTRYEFTFTREGACEAVNGRTVKQLFTQDAGISVR